MRSESWWNRALGGNTTETAAKIASWVAGKLRVTGLSNS